MKFSIGYPIGCKDIYLETVKKYKSLVSELYFSFDDFPNGRSSLGLNQELSRLEALDKQREDLKKFNDLGIKLNILFNGNCYGQNAQARSFFNKVGETLDYLSVIYNLICVTTTSPLIAKFVKQNFDNLEVRASVNMEIGAPEGMDYISDWFDSFYLKREYNRDFRKIEMARQWCDKNGKKLYGLANSGCLNYCSAHTFHDNLVAHEYEIAQMDNAYQFEGQCWEYLKKKEKREDWLSLTNFIRPEDVHLYDGLFDGLKLATRVNKNPAKIVESYCKASYNGAVTDILEPNHSGVFYPSVIDNKSIPLDFGKTVLNCSKECNKCGYCFNTQKNATIVLE